MSTFAVHAIVANPDRPGRRVGVELVVDTGASGEDMTFPMGQVLMRLNGEEMSTVLLAGSSGCVGLIGAVTLEQFALAADPVHQRLVPSPRVLL